MIRHVVLFTWTEGMTDAMEQQFAAELTALASSLPGLRAYHAGADAGINAGNFDFAVVADFDDRGQLPRLPRQRRAQGHHRPVQRTAHPEPCRGPVRNLTGRCRDGRAQRGRPRGERSCGRPSWSGRSESVFGQFHRVERGRRRDLALGCQARQHGRSEEAGRGHLALIEGLVASAEAALVQPS